jgi:hypothetical protein
MADVNTYMVPFTAFVEAHLFPDGNIMHGGIVVAVATPYGCRE